MAESVVLFGPLDRLLMPGNRMEYLLIVLALANLVTRKLSNDRYRRQAENGGADALSRFLPHTATTWLLVFASVYYTSLHHHSGIVLTTLVLSMLVADLFEFESRIVEAREGRRLERPLGAMVTSGLVVLYAAYLSLFFLVQPLWEQIV